MTVITNTELVLSSRLCLSCLVTPFVCHSFPPQLSLPPYLETLVEKVLRLSHALFCVQKTTNSLLIK